MQKRQEKIEFNALVEGQEVKLAVRRPTLKDYDEATKIYNTAFSNAIASKAIVRARLDDFLEQQGLWDQEKQAKFTGMQEELLQSERVLAKGDRKLKLSDAKAIALKMRTLRNEMRDLISVRGELDGNTAEGQADNAKFNYLVYACLVYNDRDELYYPSYEAYLNATGQDTVSYLAAQKFANLQMGLDTGRDAQLPENKFLKQFGFIDEKMRLVNKDGHLVDEKNRLIDEFGRFVNKDGKYVDKDGNPVNEAGDYDFQFEGFVDDETGELVGVAKEPEVKSDEEALIDSRVAEDLATAEISAHEIQLAGPEIKD